MIELYDDRIIWYILIVYLTLFMSGHYRQSLWSNNSQWLLTSTNLESKLGASSSTFKLKFPPFELLPFPVPFSIHLLPFPFPSYSFSLWFILLSPRVHYTVNNTGRGSFVNANWPVKIVRKFWSTLLNKTPPLFFTGSKLRPLGKGIETLSNSDSETLT